MQTKQLAPGVYGLLSNIANVYALGAPGEPWVLVDTSTSGHFEAIREAAQSIYGPNARPEAIVLTHAHFDHYGSALPLATYWDVPVFAHHLDLPYLTGKAVAPPLDPTVLGFFGFATRFMPQSGTDLGDRVQGLPESATSAKTGPVPFAPTWHWHFTPGHSPGHVSLFRDSDRVLIAGDAVTTVNLDKATDTLAKKQSLSLPPTPATSDWIAARKSMLYLATLLPQVVAAGHGIPMDDADMPAKFERFAEDVITPLHGRYIPEPAVADENGVVYLPPPAPDPYKLTAIGLGLFAAVAGTALYLRKRGDEEAVSRRKS